MADKKKVTDESEEEVKANCAWCGGELIIGKCRTFSDEHVHGKGYEKDCITEYCNSRGIKEE